MQFKKGQVKVLANTTTGREIYVNLQDVILNPDSDNELTLGNYLETLTNNINTLKKDNKKNKKAIADLVLTISKLNLK